MTWRELKEAQIDERFLDTDIQLYDVENDSTYILDHDALMLDNDDEDYLIDKNQPQLWFNWPEE
ncbi:MAG: hypothetical protein WCH09_01115 [Bacteroidota bacterium]|jgi:hypothetical protein